jgi:hypothetical protein
MIYSIPGFRLLDPTGISEGVAVAGVVAAVAAAGVGVASAANQAQEQQKAANWNAQVAATDAQVAVYQRQQQEQESAAQASITQAEGAQEASDLELRNNVLVAKNIAAAASSGLAITGSTQDVISGSAANNELQVLQVQHKTALDAWANQIGASNASYNSIVQAGNYGEQSNLDTMQAGYAAESGMFGEAGAAIGGGSQLGTTLSSPSNQAALHTLFD